MTALAMLAAPPEQARQFRDNGWWREQTFLDDLDTWARQRPDEPALITGRTSEGTMSAISYADFDRHVRRFAGALTALDVGEGDVVAFQLPDWWETAALLLAVMRVGAIAQPTLPDLRERELERVLGCTGARVMVTVDRWAGFEHAQAIAAMESRLPQLRHRVVYGDAAATGAISFQEHFLDSDADHHLNRRLDPDRACMVLFTSGSTGEAKGVLHTFNTLYAGSNGITQQVLGDGGPDRAAISLRISHIAGPLWALFGTLISGGAGVYQDEPDPEAMLDLMEFSGTTRLLAPPFRLESLMKANARRPRNLSALRTIGTGAVPIPPGLVPAVREAFGVELRAVWGMTEVVVGSIVPADAPPGWTQHSDGMPLPGLEMSIDAAEEGGVGELRVRGASLCLGTILRDSAAGAGGLAGRFTSAMESAASSDGWFATGDLARSDGRGGIRIVGRAADRVIGPTGFMVPARDVEEELLRHPRIADVALISTPSARDSHVEDVCAVVVPDGEPPTLRELMVFLTEAGMTSWFQPNRVEITESLGRDHLGKLRKNTLRARYVS